LCFVGGVKPVFIKQWADLCFNDLLKPLSCSAIFQTVVRSYIALADPELLAKPYMDVTVQFSNPAFNIGR
jgi:hypothetical protein